MPTTERLRIALALADRYRIARELGAGGMATVYLARDVKHDRDVALKVLRSDLSAVLGSERFLAEVRITARLDHPHILTLIDSGEADELLYYVMPYVRGESLRARLTREKQLAIDDAIAITRQVASALDYAHAQGIVHRDIKPENILFQEGEAVLTDFGIALAANEAGGNRLTETGISLGTPQYMSPEQATGDRTIDARSDVYSLAAVFYEMVGGEPPLTGANSRAVVAKVLTERPTSLRVIRDTVPEAMDAATLKALSKTPVDRFASAGEFARALTVETGVSAPYKASARMRWKPWIASGIALISAAALGAMFVLWRQSSVRGSHVVLRDRVQLTETGAVEIESISGDGKTLAYASHRCATTGCTYPIYVQDVGATSARVVADVFTYLRRDMHWSPDRRNLLVVGDTARFPSGTLGSYILPVAGGRPIWMGQTEAAFFAGGDSVVWIRADSARVDSWMMFAALGNAGATSRDSIRLAGRVVHIMSVPRSRFFVATRVVADTRKTLHDEWRVVDRLGRETSSVRKPRGFGLEEMTEDALWLHVLGNTDATSPVIRVPFDNRAGRLGTTFDTVALSVGITSVSEDGARLVTTEGTTEYSIWALTLKDALRGAFSNAARVVHGTSDVWGYVSPGGSRILLSRGAGTPADPVRYSTMPFEGGTELPVPGTAGTAIAEWADDTTLMVKERSTTTTISMSLVDIRTGSRRNVIVTRPPVMRPMPVGKDGWVWVARDQIKIRRGQDTVTRSVTIPPEGGTQTMRPTVDRQGSREALLRTRGTGDSIDVNVVSLGDGKRTRWFVHAGSDGDIRWLDDGSLFVIVLANGALGITGGVPTAFRIRGPGQVETLGLVPRRLDWMFISGDMQRVVIREQIPRTDAWMSRIVPR